jgi:MFS superfamily sulfate permease-like transporter
LEVLFVALLTFGFFFISPYFLPYIPTVLAAAFVLFIGLELMFEGIWKSAKALQWSEYFVVIGTVAACTFLGFSPGLGVGIVIAIVVHFWWVTVNSVSRCLTTPHYTPDLLTQRARSTTVLSFVDKTAPHDDNPEAVLHTTHGGGSSGSLPNVDIEKNLEEETKLCREASRLPNIRIVKLTGYACQCNLSLFRHIFLI